MSHIIRETSLSFAQKKQDILDYLASKPDGSVWKDFFRDASAGGVLIELLTAVATHEDFHTAVGRREGYLFSAAKKSSVIAIAEQLGYSAGRGKKKHYNLTVTPNFTGTLTKMQLVGLAKGQDVVLLEQITVNSGVPAVLSVSVGNLVVEDIVVASGSEHFFRFTSPDVSEDFRLLLNDSEVSTSLSIKDLVNDLFVILSNPVGAVDVLDLNDGNDIYDTGDTLRLQFIEMGVDFDVTIDDITFLYGTADSVVEDPDSPRQEPEALSSIIIAAPRQHETQNLVRGREDYRKLIVASDPTFISSSGHDKSIAVVEVTYLRDDLTLLTVTEKDSLQVALEEARPFGIQPPIISDPVQIDLEITADIKLLPSVSSPATIVADVTEAIQAYHKLLEQALDLEQMENDVNNLENDEGVEYIKSARISVASAWVADGNYPFSQVLVPLTPNGSYYKSIPTVRTRWVASTAYLEGDRVVSLDPVNGYGDLFEVAAIVSDGKTDSVEPDWDVNAPNPGDTVVDNNVTWRNLGTIIPLWIPNQIYTVGDVIQPEVFISVVNLVFTGVGLDDLSLSGNYAGQYLKNYRVEIDGMAGGTDTFRWSKDGGVTFQETNKAITAVAQELDEGVVVTFAAVSGHTLGDLWDFEAVAFDAKRIANVTSEWQAAAHYTEGDRVVSSDGLGYIFEVSAVGSGTPGVSGISEPIWPTADNDTVLDNDLTWKNIGQGVAKWQSTKSYTIGEVITSDLVSPGTLLECTTAGLTGGSEPAWDTTPGNTTNDGTVIWTARDAQSFSSESTWPTREGHTVRDFTAVWELIKRGNVGAGEPSFPTSERRVVQDESTVWENIGLVSDILNNVNWNEYYLITVQVNVT